MANTVSSRTSPVASSILTHKMEKAQGAMLYLKYSKGGGTSVLITPTFIDPDLNATDEYQPIYLDSNMLPQPQTFSLSASGNYRIPIPMGLGEKTLKLTFAFTGGSDQALVADVRNE